MTPARKRNLMRAPSVLLLRVPLALLLYLLYLIWRAGEYSEKALDWLDDLIPGFEREN